MFDKILIANRGEIACRVMATARRLGVRTVAVFSDADASAQHVALADEAFRIGPPAARDSYLKIDAVIDAAKRSGAKAIHPGYGFLSENAAFADACAAARIAFIGPPPAALRAMGSKSAAKIIAEGAGVPTLPGYHGEDQDPERLAKEAASIGYPVLIKAVMGGGGKGMRLVESAERFKADLEGARREAEASFGDSAVLIEKYVRKPRHVEIQIFADTKGNVVHLFERDCSLQRRHQKVVEEAPAPNLPAETRKGLQDAAVRLAAAIGYVGAGTVEFLVDADDPRRYYFMEVNARLQVEHPVTEMIVGEDLVEWQLRVASGGRLPKLQGDIRQSGHAIEARIYAEDPARNFLPSTGRLALLRAPETGPHLRIDTGVVERDTITPFYDPMIAKLIVWDADRGAALRRLGAALADYHAAGPATNVAFLRAIAQHPAFAALDLDTGFIQRHRAALIPKQDEIADRALAFAALHVLIARQEALSDAATRSGDPYAPWNRMNGWVLNGERRDDVRLTIGDKEVVVGIRYRTRGWTLELPGGAVAATAERDARGSVDADLGGQRVSGQVVEDGRNLIVVVDGASWRMTIRDPLDVGDLGELMGGDILAPMTGKIIKVMAASGDEVEKGQPLVVLEAMKMEHTLTAPRAGKIARLQASVGEQVEEGAVLVAFAEQAA
jgi:3-methylcrotonyl-CoA carboxylase alpha subunit